MTKGGGRASATATTSAFPFIVLDIARGVRVSDCRGQVGREHYWCKGCASHGGRFQCCSCEEPLAPPDYLVVLTEAIALGEYVPKPEKEKLIEEYLKNGEAAS